jgi:hypothetical protein
MGGTGNMDRGNVKCIRNCKVRCLKGDRSVGRRITLKNILSGQDRRLKAEAIRLMTAARSGLLKAEVFRVMTAARSGLLLTRRSAFWSHKALEVSWPPEHL